MKNKAIVVVAGALATLGLGWILFKKGEPAGAIDEGVVLREADAIDITSDFSLNDGHATATFPAGTVFEIKLHDNLANGDLASGDWARIYNPAYITLISEITEEKTDGSREWIYTFRADAAGDTAISAEHFSSAIGFDKRLVFNLHITTPAVSRNVG